MRLFKAASISLLSALSIAPAYANVYGTPLTGPSTVPLIRPLAAVDFGTGTPNTLFGIGVPSSGLGINGQYYVDAVSGLLYHKTSGAWGSGVAFGGTITGLSVNSLPPWLQGSFSSGATPALTIASAGSLTSHQVLGTFNGTTLTLGSLTTAELPAIPFSFLSGLIAKSQLPTDVSYYDDFHTSSLNLDVTVSSIGTGLTASFVVPSNNQFFAIVQGNRVAIASGAGSLTNTYSASQDTYVDLDSTGVFHYVAVANNATPPAVTTNSLRLAKVVTNGTAVTAFNIVASQSSAGTFARYYDLVGDVLNPVIGASFSGLSNTFTVPLNTSQYFAIVNGSRVFLQSGAAALTNTYSASQDTYVDLRFDGTFFYSPVANNAGAPAVAAQSLRIAKVVTNGSAVTGVTFLANTQQTPVAVIPANTAFMGPTSGAAAQGTFRQPTFPDISGTIVSGQLGTNLAIPGNATTVTQSPGDNSGKLATTAYSDASATAAASAATASDVKTNTNNTYSGTHIQDISGATQVIRLPQKATPGSPATSETYVNGENLQWQGASGSPVNHVAVDTNSAQTIIGKSIAGSEINSGTVPLAQMDSTVSTASNTQTLTNKSIDAGQLTGSINDARLNADVLTATSTNTVTGKSIDAGQLTGTVLDARLNADVLTATSTNTVTGKSIAASEVNSGTLSASQLPTIPTNLGGTGSTTQPTSAQIPVGDGSNNYQPQTASGDATISPSGVVTVSKTSGVAFAASATTNALNATNISSGTLADGRLSTNIPLKNAGNTFSAGNQDFTGVAKLLIPLLGSDPASSPGAIWFNGTAFKYWDNTSVTPVKHTVASLDSPAFTGSPTAPTQSALTNNTTVATTAYTDSAVSTGVTAAEAFSANASNITSGTVAPARIANFTSVAAGLVPSSGGGTSNFLRADGTFTAPPGGGTFVFPALTSSPGRMVGMIGLSLYNSSSASGTGGLIGSSAVTNTGTTTNASGSDGNWINCATTTATGNFAGVSGPAYPTCMNYLPRVQTTFKLGASANDILNCRIWVGLGNSTSDIAGNSVPSFGSVGLRYDTSVDGTAFFRLVTSNGASNSTVVATSTPVTVSAVHTFAADCSTSGSITYYLDGNPISTNTTTANFPSGSFGMQPVVLITNLASTAVNIKFKNTWIDSN